MTARVDALSRALDARGDWLATCSERGTDCVRLLHGAVEDAPGTAIDRYGDILLVQTWREPLAAGELDALAAVVEERIGALTPVWNNRRYGRRGGTRREFELDHAVDLPDELVGREEGLHFDVNPRHGGRDPLVFLDFRAGRRRVRAHSEGKSILNLFSYTCTMGVAAAVGGATDVLNVDFARSALDVGQRNATLNQVAMDELQADCLPAMRLLAGLSAGGRRGKRGKLPKIEARTYDLVVLDPPRWARSSFGAVDVVRDYQSLFKPALLATAPGGALLATNNVASVSWEDWVEQLLRCATKAGRPLGSIERVAVDPDFPSPDGQSPLKMAWITAP